MRISTLTAALLASRQIGPRSPVGPAAYLSDVVWTDFVGCSASGADLSRTLAGSSWNAGAAGTRTVSGDGYAEYTVGSNNSAGRAFGISSTNASESYATIEFCALLSSGNVTVYESGSSKGVVTTAELGDVLRVASTAGVVTYHKNGALIYTSLAAAPASFLVDAAIYSSPPIIAVIAGAKIYGVDA